MAVVRFGFYLNFFTALHWFQELKKATPQVAHYAGELSMAQTVGLIRSVVDAMVEARSKKAERQVAEFLKSNGRDALVNDRLNGF